MGLSKRRRKPSFSGRSSRLIITVLSPFLSLGKTKNRRLTICTRITMSAKAFPRLLSAMPLRLLLYTLSDRLPQARGGGPCYASFPHLLVVEMRKISSKKFSLPLFLRVLPFSNILPMPRRSFPTRLAWLLLTRPLPRLLLFSGRQTASFSKPTTTLPCTVQLSLSPVTNLFKAHTFRKKSHHKAVVLPPVSLSRILVAVRRESACHLHRCLLYPVLLLSMHRKKEKTTKERRASLWVVTVLCRSLTGQVFIVEEGEDN